MKRFRVTVNDVKEYTVVASNEEDAENVVINTPDRDLNVQRQAFLITDVTEVPEDETSREEEILELFTQMEEHGWLCCPKCQNHVEPDVLRCDCGWVNPLKEGGLI